MYKAPHQTNVWWTMKVFAFADELHVLLAKLPTIFWKCLPIRWVNERFFFFTISWMFKFRMSERWANFLDTWPFRAWSCWSSKSSGLISSEISMGNPRYLCHILIPTIATIWLNTVCIQSNGHVSRKFAHLKHPSQSSQCTFARQAKNIVNIAWDNFGGYQRAGKIT